MKFVCNECKGRMCHFEVKRDISYPYLCPCDEGVYPKWKEIKEEDESMMAKDAVSCETCGTRHKGNCKWCEDYKYWESKERPQLTKCRDPKSRYYDAGGVEVLDVIKAKLTPEQFKGWLLGNLIKYSCRANYKDQFIRDIEKVNFYSKEMFSVLEK